MLWVTWLLPSWGATPETWDAPDRSADRREINTKPTKENDQVARSLDKTKRSSILSKDQLI